MSFGDGDLHKKCEMYRRQLGGTNAALHRARQRIIELESELDAKAERTCHSEYSDRWECSECGFLDAYVTADFINYCPNCGAKVVGE